MTIQTNNRTPFVSYAQHGEDVILWRALGSRQHVSYIDVGAFDPTYDSVTRALYERGWRGINIEPQLGRLPAFEHERPEDTNISCAIGDRDGTMILAVPENEGWASTLDPSVTGIATPPERMLEVPVRRLDTLLAELGIREVDVLKIDVEGAEPAVVRGLLGGDVRPVVCVVEGVAPGVGRAAGDEAVALLVAAGYIHCLFDGLNHYLTNDSGLVEALSVPASPVDGYTTDLIDRLHQERLDNHAIIAALAAENFELRNPGRTLASSESTRDGRTSSSTEAVDQADAGAPAVGPIEIEAAGESHVALAQEESLPTADLPGISPLPPSSEQAPSAAPASTELSRSARSRRRRAMFGRMLRGALPELKGPKARATPLSVLAVALSKQTPSSAVSMLYRAILGREAETEGLAAWTARLETNGSPFEIARALAETEEAQGRSTEDRARVNADLEVWQAVAAAKALGLSSPLESSHRDEAVAEEIFVSALYEVALLRSPRPDELVFETAKLAGGAGREWMLRAFAGRRETRDRLLGAASGGLVDRLRRRRNGRHLVETFRAMVLAAEARQIAEIQRALTDSRTRLRATAVEIADQEEH